MNTISKIISEINMNNEGNSKILKRSEHKISAPITKKNSSVFM